MYVDEYNNETSYNDEQYVDYDYQQDEKKNDFWNDNKGLIIKIIIIVLCVAILIWLFVKITGDNSNNSNNQNVSIAYTNNVDTMRLAAEKYFFIDGNLPKDNETLSMSLNDLTNKGYIGSIVDASQKVCDGNASSATLTKGADSYVLTINLVCSGMAKPQIYNYRLDNMLCLNCTGITYMDGTHVNEETLENEYNFVCNEWSDWLDEKIEDDRLEVRTRILVKGYKKGEVKEKITYGEWSEYTKTPIQSSDTLEVETLIKQENVSKVDTVNGRIQASSNGTDSGVRATASTMASTLGKTSYKITQIASSSSGYKEENGKCVKYSEVKTGDLTYTQYNTYKVLNKPCDGPYVVDGKTVIKNCQYQIIEYSDTACNSSGSSSSGSYSGSSSSSGGMFSSGTVTIDVVYYRSRTKTVEKIYGDPSYTDYMEEKDLPEGYVKEEGSEKTQYSYRLKECEK